MLKVRQILALFIVSSLAGCLNLKSSPFPGNTYLYSEDSLRFLKEGYGESFEADLAQTSIQQRDWAADGRITALSISGGGMRAAAFTRGVLAELDRLKGEKGETAIGLQSIDFISSNSGGSWAVAATLAEGNFSDPKIMNRDEFLTKFDDLDEGKRVCWAERLLARVTGDKTFGQIYVSDNGNAPPTVYFNSALAPSHAPFVFTDGYLKRYRVGGFGAPCVVRDSENYVPNDETKPLILADVPLGMAAAASSAVPGYTKAWAYTRICESGEDFSFCYRGSEITGRRSDDQRDFLQLMDGGLYDNIGYKTALEIALINQDRFSALEKAIVLIDSGDAVLNDTVQRKKADRGRLLELAFASSFPNQDQTFRRLREPLFSSVGFKHQVLLDFSVASGMDLSDPDHLAYLSDLNALVFYATNHVSCYVNKRLESGPKLKWPRDLDTIDVAQQIERLKYRGGDCSSENFARTGYLHKTTYKFDREQFLATYQLGQLVVRLNEDRLKTALGI